MDCRNCGAPMELFERRRYFFCAFCGSFSFIDAPEVEGVRVLERPVPAPDCPLCASPLARALLDDVFAYYGPGNVVIDSCQRCDLIWLDFGELEQITTAGGRDRGWRISSR